jgi:hypothetical protein
LEAAVEGSGYRVEAVLNRGIADIKDAFHFLERAVMPDEGDNKGLLVKIQATQRRQRETALHDKTASRAGHPGDGQWALAIGAVGIRDFHKDLNSIDNLKLKLNKVKYKINLIYTKDLGIPRFCAARQAGRNLPHIAD